MDLAQFWNNSGGYQIDQSLRFDGSSRFDKTFGSSGNRKTFTISFWVKNTTTTVGNVFNQSRTNFRLNTTNAAFVLNAGYGSTNSFLISNASFRDPSAWYHFVLAFDTTQATSSDRVKVWVNNVLQTYSSATYPPQNQDLDYNSTLTAYIGAENTSEYLNGYLAEYYSIDGSALTPSSFGETDTTTGAWIPKRYTGSYGTNGFYLKFDPTATNGIGHDHSGNGNNWTASGFTTSGTGTDVMSDTPTTNYATLNPILPSLLQVKDGNLICDSTNRTTNYTNTTLATMGVSSGKWYYEATVNSGSMIVGWAKAGVNLDYFLGVDSLGWSYSYSGQKWNNNSAQTYGATYTTGDVIGCALDLSAGTLEFFKNGTSQGVAFTGLSGEFFPGVGDGSSSDSVVASVNFGQRAFAYTPPTGYKALNTANLPEPSIKKPSSYMDVLTWSGTGGGSGATRSLTGLGFSPDLVWQKARSSGTNHRLLDAVRGAGTGKTLSSNTTSAEGDGGSSESLYGYLSSFDSNGFTLTNGTSTFDNGNKSGDTYVAWCWDANGTGSSNNSGTITSTVSANASAGFSIVSYTSPNNSADQTVGHGLGVKPSLIIVKNRDLTYNWDIYHSSLGYNASLIFTTAGTRSGAFGAEPTSTVFTTKTGYTHNSTNKYVAYCFSEVSGYSKFGSYTGNGSTTDGPFIWCGFTPRWILIKWYKDVSSAESWHIYDTARQTYNANNTILQPDSSGIEETPSDRYINILSNGFKLRQNGQQINRSGASYIFAAFAELPFKYANAR